MTITPAHARRKLFGAHELNASEIAAQTVALIVKLHEIGIEREARELNPDARHALRQLRSTPIADALRTWLTSKRQTVVKLDVTARAVDYSLSNWAALTRFLDDGHVPIDNNAVENSVRPVALGKKLAVRGFIASRRTLGQVAQPDRVGQAQRAPSMGLSEGRVRPSAHAQAA